MYVTLKLDDNGCCRIHRSMKHLGAHSTEITVIRMLSDNVKYEILKLHAVMDPISGTKG